MIMSNKRLRNPIGMLKRIKYLNVVDYLLYVFKKRGITFLLLYTHICGPIKGAQSPMKDFKIVRGGEEDIKGLVKLTNVEHKKIRKRIDYKNSFYLVKYRGRVVGCRWVSKDHRVYPSDETIDYLPKNTIYAYGGFIHKEFRGRGLFRAVTYKIIQDNLRKGAKLSSFSSFFNISAQRAKEKFGGKKESLILHINIFDRLKLTRKIKSYK